jgi:YebC/PmpR family DNA-binding regulatory protein
MSPYNERILGETENMAGHSKWANTKHRKERVDAKRGKLFTRLLREITVASRMGGGDPDANPRLRNAIGEARSSNVPSDNIERAIKKGTGELEGASYEEMILEGYGPNGVAVLVEAMSDNRNRTVSEIRHLFSRHGGSLGENGCVAWMFDRRGLFLIPRDGMDEDEAMELALELGVDDMELAESQVEIHTSPEDYQRVRDELEERGVALETKELAMLPQSYVEVGADSAAQTMRLMEALEDHDDTQNVWANFDIDDDLLAELSAG